MRHIDIDQRLLVFFSLFVARGRHWVDAVEKGLVIFGEA